MGYERQIIDSGVDWIGEIPSQWRVEKLAGLVQEKSKKNHGMMERNLLSLSYGRIVRKNIDSNQGLLPQSFEGYNIVSPGDVVLRLTDLQNDQKSLRTALVTERGIITSAYTTISAPTMDSAYFAYAMNSCDSSKVFYGLGGGVRQSMRFQDIKQLLIPVPETIEQKSIAAYLDHHVGLIDRERALIAKKIDLLKDKRKALIFEVVTGKRTIVETHALAEDSDEPLDDVVFAGPWAAVPTPQMGDPFAKSGRLVDSGVEWIGYMPESWKVLHLKDISSLTVGKTPDTSNGDYFDGGLPWITIGDLSDEGFFPTETKKTLSRAGVLACGIKPAKKGSLLISFKLSVGKIAIAERDVYTNEAIAAISASKNALNAYLKYVCPIGFLGEATENIYGAKIFNQDKMSRVQIPLPPICEQQNISAFLDFSVQLIDRQVALHDQKCKLLSDKRKALIFEAVTGKIDLRNYPAS